MPQQSFSKLGTLTAKFNVTLFCVAFWAATTAVAGNPSNPEKTVTDTGTPMKIVAFGDSLTAGFQLPASAAFPAQLEKALRDKGHNVAVINAGVSGDTTAAGLARLDWAIPDDSDAVIVELGANDFLRGIDPAIMRANLDKILTRISEKGKPVLLAGMISPQNWGGDYEKVATPIYPDLARKHGALLYPFFVEGIARNPKLNQPDGLHPTTEGVAVIVKRILPKVEELILRVRKATAAQKG